MSSDALRSADLLLLYSTTAVAWHNTNILIITHLQTPKSINQHRYSRRQPLVVDGDMDGEGEGKKYEIAVSWAAAKKDRKPMMQTQGYSNVLLGSAGPVGVMGAVLLMPPSQDCRTLFLGGDVLSTLSDTTVLDTLLQQYFNKQYKETSDTKEKEEFYRLRWGVGSKFAFIECRTHALASVVMNDRECR